MIASSTLFTYSWFPCSDDGSVHVWRDFTTEMEDSKPTLVTAWRALTDMLPASRSKGGERGG